MLLPIIIGNMPWVCVKAFMAENLWDSPAKGVSRNCIVRDAWRNVKGERPRFLAIASSLSIWSGRGPPSHLACETPHHLPCFPSFLRTDLEICVDSVLGDLEPNLGVDLIIVGVSRRELRGHAMPLLIGEADRVHHAFWTGRPYL